MSSLRSSAVLSLIALVLATLVSVLGALLSMRPWIFSIPVLACTAAFVALRSRVPAANLTAIVAIASLLVYVALGVATIGLLYIPSVVLMVFALRRHVEST